MDFNAAKEDSSPVGDCGSRLSIMVLGATRLVLSPVFPKEKCVSKEGTDYLKILRWHSVGKSGQGS